MDVALSPYHLTTREPCAMAALLLADRVVTILPTPAPSPEEGEGESREALARAIAHSPRYHRVLNSWLELSPLFGQGVIESLHNRQDPVADARAAAARIDVDRRFTPLRSFVHDDELTSTDDALDAFCADLLKGGPDPGLSLPTVAGLDAFASRHGLMVIRSGPMPLRGGQGVNAGSLAQQAEARIGRTLLTFGLPILTQASPRTLLNAREAMRPELLALRKVIDQACAGHANGATPAALATSARAAATACAKAFRVHIGPKVDRDDDTRKRITEAFVSVQLRQVPVDSALIAALAAVGAVDSCGGVSSGGGGVSGAAGQLPIQPNSTARLHTLVITPTNVTLH